MTKSISKRQPQRSCISCHKTDDKRGLVRLVCAADGIAEVDTTGRKPGRGAYLCREPSCWQAGLKGGCLEHALRRSLNRQSVDSLMEYVKNLAGGG
jgi:predicted RNA-binding protein YlxR (DUF448 family)